MFDRGRIFDWDALAETPDNRAFGVYGQRWPGGAEILAAGDDLGFTHTEEAVG